MIRLYRRLPSAVFGVAALWLTGIALARADQLESWIHGERQAAQAKMLANISPSDGLAGAVIASPSRLAPNYYFHWTRDSALVMGVVETFNESGAARTVPWDGLLASYATFSRKNQNAVPSANSPAVFGLGEPKFQVNGTLFEDNWGRPQNDGPALRAKTLIRFANWLRANGRQAEVGNLYNPDLAAKSVIKSDLEFVAHHWTDKGFDLWEETRGYHFYTRMAQYRALREGTLLATAMMDPAAANFYQSQADAIKLEIDKHWDETKGYIVATFEPDDAGFKPSQLDMCVILASIQNDSDNSPLFSPADDRILASAMILAKKFRDLYPINTSVRADAENLAMQPGLGRYPEDRYDGISNQSQGNPWFLCTAGMAEMCYRAVTGWANVKRIDVTARNVDFFRTAIAAEGIVLTVNPGDTIKPDSPSFGKILQSVCDLGDGYLRRVHYHCDQTDGSLSEQFNRGNGFMQSAPNLTWSYAAILTAIQSREVAKRALNPAAPVAAPTAR